MRSTLLASAIFMSLLAGCGGSSDTAESDAISLAKSACYWADPSQLGTADRAREWALRSAGREVPTDPAALEGAWVDFVRDVGMDSPQILPEISAYDHALEQAQMAAEQDSRFQPLADIAAVSVERADAYTPRTSDAIMSEQEVAKASEEYDRWVSACSTVNSAWEQAGSPAVVPS